MEPCQYLNTISNREKSHDIICVWRLPSKNNFQKKLDVIKKESSLDTAAFHKGFKSFSSSTAQQEFDSGLPLIERMPTEISFCG